MAGLTALEKVKLLLSPMDNMPSDTVLNVYLDMAKEEILNWTFGADTALTDVPSWLAQIQIMAVIVGVNANGTEGDKADTVDSVSHDFKYAEMLEYIHENAPAYVKVNV